MRYVAARCRYYSDGVGIFFKTDTWRLDGDVVQQRLFAADGEASTQTFMVLPLVHLKMGVPVLVATTHLKAKPILENEALRTLHIKQILKCLGDESRKRGGCAVVFSGDLNTDPYRDFGQTEVVPKCVPAILECSLPNLASAYALGDDSDIAYTTWKKRGDKETSHVIDYVFYDQDRLGCAEVLRAVPGDAMEETKLPGFRYPSDHLSVHARFGFLPTGTSLAESEA